MGRYSTTADTPTAPPVVEVKTCEASRHPRNYTWAELMKRVYAVDVLKCGCSDGELKTSAVLADSVQCSFEPMVARMVLSHA